MTTPQRNREEVINTQLAICLSELGVATDAETIHIHGKYRPDVLFQWRGLRVILEGKFEDVPDAGEMVLDEARKRVRCGLAHIAVAVVYPVALRSVSTAKILEVLKFSRLKFIIVSEIHEGETWFEGTPASLMGSLRRVHEALTKDDIVEKTAKSLSIQLNRVAQLWMGQKGSCDRLSEILGITAPKGETERKANERRETAAKVSALVLANAFIFQEQLAVPDERISTLRKLEKEPNLIEATAKYWEMIWREINYVPIFLLGERVLNELPNNPNSILPVRALLAEAQAICAEQAALRHDLMGRIYHWLLHEAKFLGTYYTSVPAATLLLKLALAAPWKVDFGNMDALISFKVADLACGTGTLLTAAAQAFTDVFINQRAETNRSLEAASLKTHHRTLMENILHGYDVLPSALHLTASTLAMLAPEVAFSKMNLYVMPLGMDHGQPRLGSLDFLDRREVKTQIALDNTQMETIKMAASNAWYANARLPELDLCIMNPPFVRSVGGNLLFGSLPDERGRLQAELKRRVKSLGASSTAGLGSVFIAMADRHLKPGGRLALVIPAALASGEAWASTRELIASQYHLETVVASHDSEFPNFSENTSLSELLFIARKLEPKEKPGLTSYINLWRRPRSIHEAMDLFNRLIAATPVALDHPGITTIRRFETKLAEMVAIPAPREREIWEGAQFAQTELLRIWKGLTEGFLRTYSGLDKYSLPIKLLHLFGDLGYDRRDIHDAFEHSYDDWSPYSAFWGHESNKVRTISQQPSSCLLPRNTPAKGRKFKNPQDVWSKSGNILLAERLRTNTHRIIAARFEKPVLGNTWWAFSSVNLTESQEKALMLWLNSTLGLLLFFGNRVITEGAWMQMKKPAWKSMSVLDVRTLNSKQAKALASAYEKLSRLELAPLAQLDRDPVRQQIDEALSKALGLPDLGSVRELLAREPGLTAHDINPRSSSGVGEEEEDEILA